MPGRPVYLPGRKILKEVSLNALLYRFMCTGSSCTLRSPPAYCKKRSTRQSEHFANKYGQRSPPVAKKIPFEASAHGMTWSDPYHWMSNIHDPSFKAYLEQENYYADKFMSDTEKLQKQLQHEMHSRLPLEFSTPPERWGPWNYYQRIPKGKEYPILCRRLDKESGLARSLLYHLMGFEREEILLDWNEIAEQFGYVHIGKCRISPDHHYLAYTLDVSGKELFTLYVKDLRSGLILGNRKVDGVISLAWSKDGKTLLYTVVDELQRPHKVFARNLDLEEDTLIFEEKNENFCVDIMSTKDCQFITINSNSRTSSEVYLVDSVNIKSRLQQIRKRKTGVQYFVEHHSGFFYILTNAPLKEDEEPVEDYYLATCRVEDIALNKWKEGMNLEDFNPWFLPLPDKACVVVPGSNHDFKSSVFRAVISSPVMPETVVDYDLSGQKISIVHQEGMAIQDNSIKSSDQSVSSYFSKNTEGIFHHRKQESNKGWIDLSEFYNCERKEVLSYDSVKIPLTIVYSQKTKINGANPGLIYVYGAYGEVLDKQWCSDRISLLDRGWIIAFADVRGGGGGGKSWHNGGKGLLKPNSIYDFIACSRYLLQEKYVHQNMLGAIGTSAGGLLVGAAVNMYPDLFRAIILKVPFLDICNTLLDSSLPLTVLDYEEFGNPQNFNEFATIRSYSPYDNIENHCYPAMLVTAAFHDSRVGVWEAAKWVAKVRDYQPLECTQPVLLKTNMNAGHFEEGGLHEHSKETAFQYAFLIHMIETQK